MMVWSSMALLSLFGITTREEKMELIPDLEIGFLNGWVLLGLHVLVQGLLLLLFPKAVVARLFDRSGWSQRQKVFTVVGKVFSLLCLALIILTPLKTGSSVFVVGLVVYALGLVALVVAMFNFKDTPPGEPVHKGIYKISRHPQIMALFLLLTGMCVAIGSWLAFFALLASRILQHYGLLAEEEACLRLYGDSYRTYMAQVPRYFLFF
jgi:protein-S-isoprenylcysteine O-methyltransferase Ste14